MTGIAIPTLMPPIGDVPYIGWLAAAVLADVMTEEEADELIVRLQELDHLPKRPSEIVADVREHLAAIRLERDSV